MHAVILLAEITWLFSPSCQAYLSMTVQAVQNPCQNQRPRYAVTCQLPLSTDSNSVPHEPSESTRLEATPSSKLCQLIWWQHWSLGPELCLATPHQSRAPLSSFQDTQWLRDRCLVGRQPNTRLPHLHSHPALPAMSPSAMTHRNNRLACLSSRVIICIQLQPVEHLHMLLCYIWGKVQLQCTAQHNTTKCIEPLTAFKSEGRSVTLLCSGGCKPS